MKYIIKSVLVALLFVGTTSVVAQGISDEEKLQTTIKVPQLISNIKLMYVEEVDKDKLERDIVSGMNNGLSPYSVYQKEKTVLSIFPDHKDQYQSIGIQYKFSGDSLEVVEVIKGSGADAAGIKAGDKIYELDGEPFKDEYYYCEIVNRLVGATDSKTEVSFARKGELKKATVQRKSVKNYSVLITGNEKLKGSVNKYEEALKYFDAIYKDTVTNGIITEFGIRYMLSLLDPHSSYISLDDLHDMESPLKGSFSGVGVRFQIDKDTIVVAQAIPAGPSEKVGIMAGDKFIYIDGEKVVNIGMKNSGVRKRLLGEKGTKVKVEMYRKGSPELLTFTIVRDKIPIYSLLSHYMAAPKVGYLKLNNFSATSVSEIRDAVNELKREGMEDLILDLQGNGGGYLMTAVNLADELLSGSKTVVYTEGRAYPKKVYKTRYPGLLEKGRVIVLVNESSASASEIVSGAVQDWDRGLIIGRRTFSKGLVQKPVSLPDGTTVRITTSRYYTPSGRCIQKPYDHGTVEYRKEKYDRYSNGESFHKDSIKVDLTDVHYTKIKKRAVYGGGGILPDVFVALDTTGSSKYFSKLMRNGIFNKFALNYVNDNRKNLQKKYPTFASYKKSFKPEKVLQDLIKLGEAADIPYDKEGYKKAEEAFLVRIKANIAQNLYDNDKFYEIINDLNDELQVALKVLEEGKEFAIINP